MRAGIRTGLLLCAAFAAFLLVSYAAPLVVLAEKALYTVAPSQERAVRYGDRHFNAMSARLYDFEAAKYFYAEAETYRTPHPYLFHQLARIAFLEGNLNTALFHINRQIDRYGDELPNSYYMRGLIEGYKGEYAAAVEDYAHYLSLLDVPNWAAITDYSWVLLKAERFGEAMNAAEHGLVLFPDNAWLLNTSAIAFYELGEYDEALQRAIRAVEAAGGVTREEWLTAYPGNDPRIADDGIATLRASTEQNMHMIEAALASSTVQ